MENDVTPLKTTLNRAPSYVNKNTESCEYSNQRGGGEIECCACYGGVVGNMDGYGGYGGEH